MRKNIILNRLRKYDLEHKSLLAIKNKTKIQINRMDTIRKNKKKLLALLIEPINNTIN